VRALSAALVALCLGAAVAQAQQAPTLRIEREGGATTTAQVTTDHGFAAAPLSLFEDLGWTASQTGSEIRIAIPNEISVVLRVGTPFFTWDGIVLQLADAPYVDAGNTFVPLQLLTDFFPRRLPDLYDFNGAQALLRAGDPVPGGTPQAQADEGGADPGALGVGGIREKDVALGIALELARVLKQDPKLEVHLIRDDDTFVELWDRGEIATNLKGDRAGIFVSIHGNSFPDQRSTRGFETYFLSESRTEHERRVAAIENAPLRPPGRSIDREEEPDLSFIFGELRNLDTQHWSALLAEMTQQELGDVHPGPDRGVKQGVLAVLTNALMPSILVEVGYLSNADESRLMSQKDFQTKAAESLGRAVKRFFERYPPGSGSGQ